jgi:hypothetical protein
MDARGRKSGGRGLRTPGSVAEGTQAKGGAITAPFLDGAERTFLAPEFGAKLDESGEPLPVKISELALEPGLKQLALKLWRDFQTGRVSVEKSLQGAGLEKEDLWKPGISETLTTSSTNDEISRYRQKLQYRADFLEAALEETLLQLEGLENYRSGANRAGSKGEVNAENQRGEESSSPDA